MSDAEARCHQAGAALSDGVEGGRFGTVGSGQRVCRSYALSFIVRLAILRSGVGVRRNDLDALIQSVSMSTGKGDHPVVGVQDAAGEIVELSFPTRFATDREASCPWLDRMIGGLFQQ